MKCFSTCTPTQFDDLWTYTLRIGKDIRLLDTIGRGCIKKEARVESKSGRARRNH